MGRYINDINQKSIPAKGKVQFILENVAGAQVLDIAPDEWEEGLVCVVDNGPFEAAAYAYSPSELAVFKRFDGRPKTWMHVPNAEKLAE